MATVLNSSRDLATLQNGRLREWAYNAMDCCITHEVFGKIHSELDSITSPTYDFSRLLIAPVLEMMSRGIKIDVARRAALAEELSGKIETLKGQLYRILRDGMDIDTDDFNWNSPDQLCWLFYEHMRLPVYTKDKKPTAGRDALEKLARYSTARPIVRHLLLLKDMAKMRSTLRSAIDADDRMRCTFGIAGTETGRFSSYKSGFGKGTNLQNQDPEVRYTYVADPGMKMAYIDLEQAESRAVGAKVFTLFGDPGYLNACEAGDLHTEVAKMVWPHIRNRSDADVEFYNGDSYRQIAKKLGHATNYLGQPFELQNRLKITRDRIEDFQARYLTAFPGIRQWHQWVVQQLSLRGYIVSLTGRKRWFLGRRDEDATVGEAVAYDPQETVARLLNQGMFNIWWDTIQGPRVPVQLLLQVHDACTLQYPEAQEDTIFPYLLNRILVPITLTAPNGQQRKFVIPSEGKTGWNWGERFKSNADGTTYEFDRDGLTKWKGPGKDTRTRQRVPA